MEDLYSKLMAYGNSDVYPFHMPGHKRNKKFDEFYKMDITEIEGFDNLHHPENIILEAEQRAAHLFGSEETFFLVNGSTSGILAAISSISKVGSTVLVARNSHKSVYHGIYLNNLKVTYLIPDVIEEFDISGGIDPEEVRTCIEQNKEIAGVVITSPTYDGVVSDIRKIAEIVHEYGIPLIVDEAHGAHFPLWDEAPESAISCGADIVIHSLHKTLPSLTQTALLHANGTIVNRDKIRKFLGIFQSSSPSYVLMASIDRCISEIICNRMKLFQKYYGNLRYFCGKVNGLDNIKLLGPDIIGKNSVFDFDQGKLVLSVKQTSLTGPELYHILLHKYHLQMEMTADTYVIGMTSIMDEKEGLERLINALLEINENCTLVHDSENFAKNGDLQPITPVTKGFNGQDRNLDGRNYKIPKEVFTIKEAYDRKMKEVLLRDSADLISGEFLYVYPPGIPLLVPGERITEEVLHTILHQQELSLSIQGISDKSGKLIKVIDDYI